MLSIYPAGTYPIGDDNSGYDNEKPAHTVTVDAFQIGQFPLTNAEYALFIEADSYEDECWWTTDAARAWLRGEGSTNGLDEWYPFGKVYHEPEYWNDTRFNNPSQPVVGITWFEARAYCAWLSGQTGWLIQLPTEVQFEVAARGKDGRLYPYGMTFDHARSNTFESHIRRTTPVGIFDNATPEGVFDLTGNAYTWTSSIYDQKRFGYPYRAEDGHEDLDDSIYLRVLRGESWRYFRGDARAVFRGGNLPRFRSRHSGFRVVRAPS